MTQANISIRIDESLKQKFDALCNELGFNMTTAINIFVKAVIRENGIPFALSINDYNKETQKVIEDAHKGIGLSKPYNSVDEMMTDILKED